MSSRLNDLLARATVEELVALTAGHDFWHTRAIERLGIPAMRVSDGPVGARGTRFDGEASINAPCGTLLAATFDPETVEAIGQMLGRETRAKGASVLLAPTVNLHRTPVGGRNFECMSEDPYLTARTAVAYVRGVQSEGVASCIKHFVGNDTEFERNTIDSHIDERTLRELYLVPFEAAVTEAGVQAVMTAYNRINGPWAADSPLLADVLRGEWGFDGLVMSDWFGLHSTAEAVTAGLDLEMPGPSLHRGKKLLAAVESGEVSVEEVRTLARRVLELMERTGALDAAGPGPETTRHDEVDVELVRRTAAQGMVLLRNAVPEGGDNTVLPLDPVRLRRVAIIGPNADVGQIMGGGSAHVTPVRVSNPLDALTTYFAEHGVDVVYSKGVSIHRRLPEVDVRLCDEIVVEVFASSAALDADEAPLRTRQSRTSRLMWVADPRGPGHDDFDFGVRVRTVLTPDASGAWELGVESVGAARLFLDGEVVLDNTELARGGSFFGMGRGEVRATVTLEAGREYSLVVEMRQSTYGQAMSGLNIGALALPSGDLMREALDAAASADMSIVIVGTNDDWESEGWDRVDIELPGCQDELVQRVADVSPATVVVVNAGSPVGMPWLEEVEAVLMAWFPGQEMGRSLVDVLSGAQEPQGRLPVTFPARMQDTPAGEHHPGRNGVAQYREGRLMGYRWYDSVGRVPLFPFGFGLGYSYVAIDECAADSPYRVTCRASNAGSRDAVEVVQVYAHEVDRDPLERDEADQRLVGFLKVRVPAGASEEVVIDLDPHAYRTWDTESSAWRQRDTLHELRIGRSSRDIVARLEVMP